MKPVFRLPNARRDVNDELAFHLEMRTREFIEQGLSPEEARRAAMRAFGDVSAVDAELRHERVIEAHRRERASWWAELRSDVAYAWRTLRKSPGFTAAALATLALGIGATTAVFTVVNGVLVRPLPYADPSRLVMVWLSSRKDKFDLPLSSGFYTDVARSSATIAATAPFRSWGYSLAGATETEHIEGARVGPTLFGILGVRPRVGRDFRPEDAEFGAPDVVMLSDALWRSRFGGDPAIVGKSIDLSGKPHTVIGVMPPGFGFPRGAELPAGLQFSARADLWTPLVFTERDKRNYSVQNLSAVARLKSGVSPLQLKGTLDRDLKIFLAANAPKVDLVYAIRTLRDQAASTVRRTLLILLAAVALLLFIACANVVNLLVARTSVRKREFAVRAALGAGRGRIARQLVTENILLTLGGTIVGLAMSMWATHAMIALAPGTLPRADDITLDWRVALGAAAVTLVVGLIFGLVASTQVGWHALAGTLREEGTRTGGGRSGSTRRAVLVVAEVSLSLVLLIGASLLTLSFRRLQRVEPGFDPSGTLTAGVSLPVTGPFNPQANGPRWAAFFRQLQERVARLPGVEAAGAISVLPLAAGAEGGGTAIVGEPPPAPGQALHTEYFVVEGDYFKAMHIKLLGGRAFANTDVAESTPVVIVNREYARRYLNDRALDRQIRTFFDFNVGTARTIIGVVDNVQSGSLDGSAEPQAYVPQQQMSYPGLELVLRTSGDPTTLVAAVKQAVRAIDPGVAVSHTRTMRAVFDASLARRRFSMTLIGVFAGSAVVLAMIGLYGVVAVSVGERRREIGVRMALGARPSDVLRLIVGQGLRITLAGVALGLLGAYAASRFVSSLLYGTSATSAGVYAAASVGIVLVTLAATYGPARRATRVDPTTALRS